MMFTLAVTNQVNVMVMDSTSFQMVTYTKAAGTMIKNKEKEY